MVSNKANQHKENENARNYHFRRQSNRPKLGRVCKRCGMGMDILELARKTGKTKWFGTHPDGTNDFLGVEFSLEQLKHFYHAAYAAGVAAEKARCAALCSEVAAGKDAEAIEEAILARGDK